MKKLPRMIPIFLLALFGYGAPSLGAPAPGPATPAYPVMLFDEAAIRQYQAMEDSQPEIRAARTFHTPDGGAYSLLPNLCYNPVTRAQNNCGNCWQWVGTGLLEIYLSTHFDVFNRLSVQFISSCFEPGVCCNGGSIFGVAQFYNTMGFAIPWSNTNAEWRTGDGVCRTCDNIDTAFRYPMQGITYEKISTHGIGPTQAIQNIKSVLHQGRAVAFSFFLPYDTDMADFFDYYNGQAESDVWDFDTTCGHIIPNGRYACHDVLCVGYNDISPGNGYWIMVNSWGATAYRPHETFRVKMDMNYDCTHTFTNTGEKYSAFTWHTLAPEFTGMWDDIYDYPDGNNGITNVSNFGHHWERQWLSEIGPEGRQYNDDWYQVEALAPNLRFVATCRFTHAEGNIELELVNTAKVVVASSCTDRNGENLDVNLAAPGTYFLRVYGGAAAPGIGHNTGSRYDLWWDDLPLEDVYEENDTPATAWDLTATIHPIWLSELRGRGRQVDADWYRIEARTNHLLITATCTFSHAEGDIDLALYATSGRLASSESSSDREVIHAKVPAPGDYYLCVYGYGAAGNRGNLYDLWWDDGIADDAYETNNSWATAYYPGYDWRGVWLSTMSGPGVQLNQDWYRIQAPPDALQLSVTCLFVRAEGAIELRLYNTSGLVAQAPGGSALEYAAPGPGTYYILVSGGTGGNQGNAYDLRWDARNTNVVVILEDRYETNNTLETAFDLCTHRHAWLSALDGLGRQRDADWYRIEARPGAACLVATCTFTHAEGNVELALYNTGGRIVDSTGTGNVEVLHHAPVSAGVYSLLVYGANRTNGYDLWWDDIGGEPGPGQDDLYETNNTAATAFDLSGRPNAWLSSLDGPGVQADQDWFSLAVGPDESRLVVTCLFTHAEGDIDIALYDSNVLLAASVGITDMETLEATVPGPGAYQLLVYGPGRTNHYDFWWAALKAAAAPPEDDAYETNDYVADAWQPGGDWAQTWLSTLGGLGMQRNVDWFRIEVPPDARHVAVTCTFTHAEGNIDLALYSASQRLAESAGTGDEESLEANVSEGGAYYLLVYGENRANTYDLWWNATSIPDDAYEPNNLPDTAFEPGDAWSNRWLSSIGGPGIQSDDDWFRITVDPAHLRVTATCLFTHADGDIDLALTDSNGVSLAQSTGATDAESLCFMLPRPGVYYLRVYGYLVGGNQGNPYDLWWDLSATDDAYEENDELATAYDLRGDIGASIAGLRGPGIQMDPDWFRIAADGGAFRIMATCTFTHAEGNINLALYSATGQLAASTGTADEESILYEVPEAGSYYLLVYGDNATNAYDLWWNAEQPDTPQPPWILYVSNSVAPAGHTVGVWTEPNRHYSLQATTNLGTPAGWELLDEAGGYGEPLLLLDSNPPGRRFYRVVAEPILAPTNPPEGRPPRTP